MAEHVRIAAWVRIIYSAIGLLVAAFVFLVVGGGVFAIGMAEGEPAPGAIVATVFTFILAIIAVCALPGLITGWGMLRFYPWARIVNIVLSALDLFNFPIGTAIGAYSLWVLLHPDGARLFEQGGSTAAYP